jgi:hypothetical protein
LVSAEPCYGTSAQAIERTSENQPRYIRITDFGDDGISLPHEFMAAESWDPKHLLLKGDILFARSGATVGKTYIHDECFNPSVFAGYCIRFRFSNEVLPEYIYGFTKTDTYSQWITTIQRPAAQPNINKEEFKSLAIPVPPLSVQRRLVSALEAARAKRDKALEEARIVWKSALENFERELLPTGASVTTHNQEGQLVCFATKLGNILNRRFDPGFIRYSKKSSYFYPVKALADLVSEEPRYGTSSQAVERTSADQPRYIRITDFGDDGISMPHEFKTASQWNDLHFLLPGDILFARSGSVGKTYIHDKNFDPAVFAGYCIRFRFKKGVLPEFVYGFTKTEIYAHWVKAIQRSAVQANINKEEFKSLEIPVPPLSIQHQIVSNFESARTKRDELLAFAESVWRSARLQFERELLE